MVTTLRSISLRLFPTRTRCSYAVTWRTERGEARTDRRLYWGDVPIPEQELADMSVVHALRLVVEDLERLHGYTTPREAGREPRGALGGGSPSGQRLAGIDPDE